LSIAVLTGPDFVWERNAIEKKTDECASLMAFPTGFIERPEFACGEKQNFMDGFPGWDASNHCCEMACVSNHA
jgi:hypothetical protein